MNKYRSQAIAVDFDGVIAEFSEGIEKFGKPIPGAKEALAELRRLGYKIIIHTARPSRKDHLDSLANYLTEEGIPFDNEQRGHVLKLESLSLPIRLSTFLRTFLSLAMVFEALRTSWDTADSLTLYPYCRAIISP